jgi:hypothetical protein
VRRKAPLVNLKTRRRQDADFDYGEYVRVETEVNRRKFPLASFSREEAAGVASDFRAAFAADGRPPFGLCQGVRNGAEVRVFSRRLGFRVLGTDISDTVLAVPDGVLMDFHDCPRLWRGRVDFLYSNSWDQSYDPPACLAHWAELLSERGLLYLQHTPNHLHDSGLSVEALREVMNAAGVPCQRSLTFRAPSAPVVLLRRARKAFARLAGRPLPMSRPMAETVVLVGRRAG